MEGCRECSAQAPVKASGEGEHEPKGAYVVEDEEEGEVGEVVVKEERPAEQEVKEPALLEVHLQVSVVLPPGEADRGVPRAVRHREKPILIFLAHRDIISLSYLSLSYIFAELSLSYIFLICSKISLDVEILRIRQKF